MAMITVSSLDTSSQRQPLHTLPPRAIVNRQNAVECSNSAQAVINAATVAASRSIQQAQATASQAVMQASISASAAIGQYSASASQKVAAISKSSAVAASQASEVVASLMVSSNESGGLRNMVMIWSE